MEIFVRRREVGFATAFGVLLSVVACGGGGGGGGGVASETDVSTTVIDGAIQGAVVCMDLNLNGVCDAGEPTGRTDAAGKVTLKVLTSDAGRYPLLAEVGTDAVDVDTGPVQTAFTMMTPADRTAVVSPLTTLVATSMTRSGLDSTEAETLLRSTSGLQVSLFEDFTASTTEASDAAGSVARMIVLTMQDHSKALDGEVGKQAADNTAISRAQLRAVVRDNLLTNLNAIAARATKPEVVAARGAARDKLLATDVTQLVASSGLTVETLPILVAANTQIANPTPPSPHVPTGGFSLSGLEYTDASNYSVRFLTSSLAQDTPDSNNRVRYQHRRFLAVDGVVATWSTGGSVRGQSDQHWNGRTWVGCGLNHPNESSLRDAKGESVYNYCDNREIGRVSRAEFDVFGRKMIDVYDQLRSSGATNITIHDRAALGQATFPEGSRMRINYDDALTTAYSYSPGRAAIPGTGGNTLVLAGAAVGAGGDTRTQSGLACAGRHVLAEVTTLESMVDQAQGKPCISGPYTFTYQSVSYTSPGPNSSWGNTSVSLGTVGSAPVNSGTAPGYYTTNTRYRVAFDGGGSKNVTYLSCRERFNDGSTRDCVNIGRGTYAIENLGDARVMTFENLPSQTSALSSTRVFVERGGLIYYGWKSRERVYTNARLNAIAGRAIVEQLGLVSPDPEKPLQTSIGSFQGSWDLWFPSTSPSRNPAINVNVVHDGSATCTNVPAGSSLNCTLNITDATTGDFTLTLVDTNDVLTGRFDFVGGQVSGSSNTSSAFTGSRR